MRATTVRIIKRDGPAAWYAKNIGWTFKVYVGHHKYILEESYNNECHWRFIDFEDAVEVCEPDGEGEA